MFSSLFFTFLRTLSLQRESKGEEDIEVKMATSSMKEVERRSCCPHLSRLLPHHSHTGAFTPRSNDNEVLKG
jgi:hypothetical protein